MKPYLPDILQANLDVIFVGAAPSPAAAAIGHYYAGSRNRFWQLLHQSGFTPRLLTAEEDHDALRYGIGLTAIYKSIISTDNSYLPEPCEWDREELRNKLLAFAPKVVCYNGKDVYRMFHGEEAARWGELDERLGKSLQFVVHSSSGRADRWGADRLYLYGSLKALVLDLRGG
jgi:TDG/mug DNA glycosylase family protein